MKNRKLTLVFTIILTLIIFILSLSCAKNKDSSNNNDMELNADLDINTTSTSAITDDKKITNNNDKINWDDYDKLQNVSSNNDKSFMIFFYADWCPYCKKMEETTFTDKEVIELLNNNFVSLKINSESKQILSKTNKNITGISLAQKYQITGLPTVVFLDKKGVALTAVPGYLSTDLFIIILKYIYTESYKNESFESFRAKQK